MNYSSISQAKLDVKLGKITVGETVIVRGASYRAISKEPWLQKTEAGQSGAEFAMIATLVGLVLTAVVMLLTPVVTAVSNAIAQAGGLFGWLMLVLSGGA